MTNEGIGGDKNDDPIICKREKDEGDDAAAADQDDDDGEPRTYYAVRRGRSRGIFLTWEDCRAQVGHLRSGVEAEFREFHDLRAAAEYVRRGIAEQAAEEASSRAKATKSTEVADAAEVAGARGRGGRRSSPRRAAASAADAAISSPVVAKRKRGRPRKSTTTATTTATPSPTKRTRKAKKASSAPAKVRTAKEAKTPTKENDESGAADDGQGEGDEKEVKQPTTPAERMQIRLDEKFDARIEQLKAFKAEHGHCRVSQTGHDTTTAEGRALRGLGLWVNTQRKEYKCLRDGGFRSCGKHGMRKTTLTAERIQKLLDLGFEFSRRVDGRNYTWEERLEQLCEYSLAHEGDCNSVPKTGQHRELRVWVDRQIEQYRKYCEGRPTPMTEERIDKLNRVGFVFPEKFKRDSVWEDRFEELKRYKAQHGDCLVPKDMPGLGSWVHNQRKRVKNLDDKLSDDRVRRLTDIGFVFAVRTRRWYKKPPELDLAAEAAEASRGASTRAGTGGVGVEMPSTTNIKADPDPETVDEATDGLGPMPVPPLPPQDGDMSGTAAAAAAAAAAAVAVGLPRDGMGASAAFPTPEVVAAVAAEELHTAADGGGDNANHRMADV